MRQVVYTKQSKNQLKHFLRMCQTVQILYSATNQRRKFENIGVGISKNEALAIYLQTLKQSDNESWYVERSKRITSSPLWQSF